MKIISYKDIEEEGFFQKIDLEKLSSIDEIIENVKNNGDSALIEYSKRFNDGDFKNADDFLVSEKEIEDAYKKINPKLLEALKIAIENVKNFAHKQIETIKELEIKKEGNEFLPYQYRRFHYTLYPSLSIIRLLQYMLSFIRLLYLFFMPSLYKFNIEFRKHFL